MASYVILLCPECGKESYVDELDVIIADEATGKTENLCDRCERNGVESFLEASDWT